MVITETRRHDSTWIVEGELKDRSALSDELADFCAQYPIHRVKEAQESLEVTATHTQGEVIGLTAFSSFMQLKFQLHLTTFGSVKYISVHHLYKYAFKCRINCKKGTLNQFKCILERAKLRSL